MRPPTCSGSNPTLDTALRLGKYFGVSPEIWLNLQVDYDMRIARRTIWPSVEPRIADRGEV
jgi:plasmid maintenance system antidote protein VapI